jgi:hypothetical protein
MVIRIVVLRADAPLPVVIRPAAAIPGILRLPLPVGHVAREPLVLRAPRVVRPDAAVAALHVGPHVTPAHVHRVLPVPVAFSLPCACAGTPAITAHEASASIRRFTHVDIVKDTMKDLMGTSFLIEADRGWSGRSCGDPAADE